MKVSEEMEKDLQDLAKRVYELRQKHGGHISAACCSENLSWGNITTEDNCFYEQMYFNNRKGFETRLYEKDAKDAEVKV